MKKPETVLKEYINHLSLDNLKYLSARLESGIGADLAEALDIMSKCPDLDRWLLSAKSYTDFYDMLDDIQEYIFNEIDKRTPELQQA